MVHTYTHVHTCKEREEREAKVGKGRERERREREERDVRNVFYVHAQYKACLCTPSSIHTPAYRMYATILHTHIRTHTPGQGSHMQCCPLLLSVKHCPPISLPPPSSPSPSLSSPPPSPLVTLVYLPFPLFSYTYHTMTYNTQ